ncbi:MAG: sulfatase-like hydrolase/transferase [Verrucomicrobia bacterium]|nr:sulfatase-like hydrolase/transferase [Verrucomicrobiota bacterium]
MKHVLAVLFVLGLVASSGTSAAPTSPKPNILWITCEDICPQLGCYGDSYARTPNLDAFARQAVRYTRAFATAPVCSPARSCLITGMYATSLGTQRLRSTFPVPAEFRGFPAWLREAGYYCSNNVKTDYNLRGEAAFIRDAWDVSSGKAHWRGRKPGQPFFAVFNLMTTHQSRTSVFPHEQFEKMVGSRLAPEERHDPARAPVPPYYPDTPESRRMLARYYDCITAMDKEVAALLRALDEDGLANDTIVFFYSDNGMGIPRGKRCLFDTGLWEPLIIRFPEKFRHLAPGAPGSVTDRLVSFVDFGPTVLSLAGLPVPKQMQGVPFAGPAAGKPRKFVFGVRDRVDEAFDLSRSVRDGRWLYIRNFMPHLSWMPPERFSDGSTMRREFKRLAAEGRLGADQLTYAAPRKPIEELYDSETDPHQVKNLATVPAHRATLEKMRRALREWLLTTRDGGFLTEPQMRERIGADSTPFTVAKDPKKYPLVRLLDAADLVGRSDAVPKQERLLSDPDDGVRYWAAVGLRAAGKDAAPARNALRAALKDACAVVRIEAAVALVQLGETEAGLRMLENDLRSEHGDVALHAARALELLGEAARPAVPAMRAVLDGADRKTFGEYGLFLRFSLEAALEQLQPDTKPAKR